MKDFQSVETLLEAWRALHPRSKLGETMNEPAFYEGGIVILETALEILKRPPNTRMQTGLEVECWYCHRKYGLNHKCGVCGREGR